MVGVDSIEETPSSACIILCNGGVVDIKTSPYLFSYDYESSQDFFGHQRSNNTPNTSVLKLLTIPIEQRTLTSGPGANSPLPNTLDP